MAKRFLRTAFLLAPLLTSGCATLSFAPPPVPFDGHATYTSNDKTTRCNATINTGDSVTNRDNSKSAVNLIDNYAGAYGCAVQSASNGRQFFQIPSQLAALLGIASAAFNGPRNVALGAGIGAATFNSGNAYWAPQDKAQIFDAALDAILCIRTTAVGIEPYDTNGPAKLTSGDEIALPVAWRYYDTISAALGQVDRIAGSRLRATGKFDPEGLVAQIKQLTEDIKKQQGATGEGGTPMATPSGTPTAAASGAPAGQNAADDGGGPNGPAKPSAGQPSPAANGTPDQGGTYTVNIPLMQSKMQLCVVRAKL